MLRHASSLQPLLQQGGLHRERRQEPVLAAAVAPGPDVALPHPWRRMLPCEGLAAWREGIRGRTLGTAARGGRSAHSLREGIQGQQVQGLHRPVVHRGARQRARALRALALRNGDAPVRARAPAALSPGPASACLLLRGLLHPTISPRGLPAVVVRHPLHGTGCAAARGGQEMVHGTDLAPSSRLHCLPTTRLEPPHRPVDGLPVHGVPGHRASGAGPRQCGHRGPRPARCQPVAQCSGDARPDGRLPAGAWGYGARARHPSPAHDRVACASSLLLVPHACRRALRRAVPCGRRPGFPCVVAGTTHGGGARCPPVAWRPMTRHGEVLVPAPGPCWPKPARTFGLLSVTMCIERSPGVAIPSILAPSPSWG